MAIQKALIKISLQGKGDAFLVSEYEPKNYLTLKLLDIKRNKSYIGQVSDLDLRTQAAKIRLTFCDFIEKSIRALFQTQKDRDFIYILEENDSIYSFNWKCVDDEETVIDIGSIQMNDQEYVSAFNGILLSLANEIHHLNTRIKTLSDNVVDYKTQAENAMNQLSDAINIKNNLEEEMYAKFLLILNEKKRKITELSDKKKSFKKSHSDHNHNIYKSKKQKSHTISDASDDEKAEFFDINEPGPSMLKKNNSLLFSDEDDIPVVPIKPTKVRNRKDGNKKRAFNDEIMSSNVESVLSQVIDDDSDDSLLGKL